MKVLFITSAYPAHKNDPRGIHIHRLARGLCHAGVQVTVLTPGVPFPDTQDQLDGVTIGRVSYWIPKWQRLAVGLGGIMPNISQNPWLVLQIPSLLMTLSWRAFLLAPAFDVIHAHWLYPAGIAGVMVRKLRKRPLVITSHGGDLNLARRSRSLRLLASSVSHGADTCIGVSEALCQQFVELGIPATKVTCIPVGVDRREEATSSGDETSATYQEFVSFPGFRLVYVGSLIQRKSVETLLLAHEELQRRGRSVASAIVGPGPEKDSLVRMVRARSLRNVFFAESHAPSVVPGWMSGAHTLVLPSLSEGRPTVVMEALALGVPVIATDIEGTRELILEGKTGLLFPPQNVSSLAECIERLMDNPQMREDMGRRAQTFIETQELTTPRVVQKHLTVYKQLCNANVV